MARQRHGVDSARRKMQERSAKQSRGKDPEEEDQLKRRFREADTLAEAVTVLMEEADTSRELTDETRRKLVEVAEACRDE